MTQPPSSPFLVSKPDDASGQTQAMAAPGDGQDELGPELRELVLGEMRRRDQFRSDLRTFLAKHLQQTDDLLTTLLEPDEGLNNLLQRCLDLVSVKKREKEFPCLRQEVDSGISNSMTVGRGSSCVLMRLPSTEIRHRDKRQGGVFSGESLRLAMTIAESPETSSGAKINSPVEHNELNS